MSPRKALQPICANAVPSQRACKQPRSVGKPLRFLEDDAVVLAAVFSDDSPASVCESLADLDLGPLTFRAERSCSDAAGDGQAASVREDGRSGGLSGESSPLKR